MLAQQPTAAMHRIEVEELETLGLSRVGGNLSTDSAAIGSNSAAAHSDTIASSYFEPFERYAHQLLLLLLLACPCTPCTLSLDH